MRRLIVSFVLVTGCVASAHASGVVSGTVWPTRGEARRAELAAAQQPAREREHHGLFDFLGSPGMHQPAPVRVQPATAPRPGGVLAPTPRRSDLSDAVITVTRVPDVVERRMTEQQLRDRHDVLPCVTIHGSRYNPRVMVIAAGSDLVFQNLDRIWHSTFSVSAARRFDLGKLKPGAADTVHFGKPGVINLHCDIHPEESGFLVVAPQHAYARPDAYGRFSLPRLPAGTYQLVLWHPLRGTREQSVTIPKRGDVTCQLAF